MISISGMAHIGIREANFKRFIDFYSQPGCRLIRDDMHERVVVLKHPTGIEIKLLDSLNSNRTNHNVLIEEPLRYAGYTHMALRVADVHQSVHAIGSIDIKIIEGPVKFADGSTSIFFRDPDKNVIELSQAIRRSKSMSHAHNSQQKDSLL